MVFNTLTIRRLAPASTVDTRIAVVIPMRNEVHNVNRAITQLLEQKYLSHLTVIAVDDNSTDGTTSALASYSDSGLDVVTLKSLSEGWLGKSFALQQGYLRAIDCGAEIVVTVDADVILANDAIARSVLSLGSADALSPYPAQDAETLSERLIQPLLQWSWMASLPQRISHRLQLPSMAVANGQLMVYRSSVLQSMDGFTSVKNEVLDDVRFVQHIRRRGFRTEVIIGRDIASTRMYSSLREITHGYGKSLFPTFGYLGSILLALFLTSTSVLPFLGLFSNDIWALIGFGSILTTRMISAVTSGNRVSDAILHPISITLFIYVLFYSMVRRGRVQWKGRSL